ncbi:hypothetical protein IVB69_02770 [Flavobacterium sp. J49]|uniref:hypothetical protein n=1 Tax=Flavobacterium sp. J49 TaxID=2718534 RepID=UPI00159472C8|nr:hypothetical protein [Flavobacterium sp. J49]MBF6640396.1 hypothetical protein [Flavobacterium sp. J49]NIC01643.1 hypothetical protein [Flavobacterium sp. J49]
MLFLKRLLDFYINSSIHVALSVYALVRMTGFLFQISAIEATAFFAFFGTIVGYNFVKYDALARTQKLQMRTQLKVIAVLSFLSLLACGFYFLQLAQKTKIIAVVFLILTLLYTLPFFPNKKNARNWAGVKIYIVALCWVGVTLFLPIINAEISLTTYVFLVAIQRFILIFVLILIFEIIDLKQDDPHLKTVPQQIGVERTKKLGFLLLFVFVGLEFLYADFNYPILFLKIGIAVTVLLFLIFANEKRSKYYSSFWAESIPFLWWVLLLLFG